MDANLKAKWIGALRSGIYQQGQNTLRSQAAGPEHVKHCCLGVLGELMGARVPAGCGLAFDYPEGHLLKESHGDFTAISYLPEWVESVAGLNTDVQHELSRLNDSGSSFDQIADWIEVGL